MHLITLLLFTFVFQFIGEPADSIYYKGKALIEKGESTEALNYWLNQRDQFVTDAGGDFRIGKAFLEVAVKENRESLFPIAAELYKAGLDNNRFDEHFDYISREAKQIIPLINEEKARRWRVYIDDKDPRLVTEIKSFWINANPSVTSPFNERLIEHYERIDYSRKNFTRNTNSVYETDDRGLIYTRYGKPDSTTTGQFNLSSNKVQFFSREIIRQQEEARELQDSQQQTNGTAIAAAAQSTYLDNLAKAATDRVLSSRISGGYEVWIYSRQVVSLPENLIFIFGEHADTGHYGLRGSPEDFIPNRSFRNRDLRIGNYRFNIGSILQLTIYDDLKFIDDKFSDIYYDLFDRLMSDQSIISESASEYLSTKYAHELASIRESAPANLTLYDRHFRDIVTFTKTYSFLDDQLEPKQILLVYSNPHNSLYADYIGFLDDNGELGPIEPSYHLRHRVGMYDRNWNSIRYQNDFPSISFTEDEITGEFFPSVSIFSLPGSLDSSNYIATSSLFNETYLDIEEKPYEQLRTPQHLIAETSKTLDLDQETSELRADQFEASDLIIGYRGDFEFDEDLLIPFYVPFETIFSRETDLYFMFEVYNIPLTSDFNHNFMIDVQVNSTESEGVFRRIFGRSRSPEERITLDIESSDSFSKQTLSINISDYDPGDYELHLTIYNEEQTERIERVREFQIR